MIIPFLLEIYLLQMVFNSLARLFQKVFLSRILSNNLGFQVLSPGEITNKGYFQYAKFRGGGGKQGVLWEMCKLWKYM